MKLYFDTIFASREKIICNFRQKNYFIKCTQSDKTYKLNQEVINHFSGLLKINYLKVLSYSRSTTETVEKGVKYVHSFNSIFINNNLLSYKN